MTLFVNGIFLFQIYRLNNSQNSLAQNFGQSYKKALREAKEIHFFLIEEEPNTGNDACLGLSWRLETEKSRPYALEGRDYMA
ncbi:MAG: hypothetical protein SO214_05980 [Prevotella pectinovora]|uniref:hypothetical protein n=1 Tax=Prevotella pectinovora TaxID=1602169 RepID=UPI002A7F5689|nr:hypothetical protein [Prevotella pectinovora]MDY4778982.1 hypothetical protein [Prevotella pectinovora]